ncbi:MAG TPA: hypothetical protein VGG44_09595, partial [Tepidisphaeraceae bacterium]
MNFENSSKACLVDVFENYLDESISVRTSDAIGKLTPDQVRELLYAVEKHLEMAAWTKGFSVDSICVEGSGVSVLYDIEPILTPKIKQLALYYPRLILPWDDIAGEYTKKATDKDRHLLQRVVAAIVPVAPLLRSHVLTPLYSRVFGKEADDELILKLVKKPVSKELFKAAWKYFPVHNHIPMHEKHEVYRDYLGSLYGHLLLCGRMKAAPGIVDPALHALFSAHLMETPNRHKKHLPSDGTVANGLITLQLPGIADISAEDLIAIRESADEFREWRQELGSALHRVGDIVADGESFNKAFQDQLSPVRERADRMKSDLLKGSLKSMLKDTLVNTTIGAVSVAGGVEIAALAGRDFDAFSSLATLASIPLLTIIVWLLFGRSDPAKVRLLRF